MDGVRNDLFSRAGRALYENREIPHGKFPDLLSQRDDILRNTDQTEIVRIVDTSCNTVVIEIPFPFLDSLHDGVADLLNTERLGQKRIDLQLFKDADVLFAGETAYDNGRRQGKLFPEITHQVNTRAALHLDVGYNDVNGVRPREIDRFTAVVRDVRRIASAGKRIVDKSAHHVVVIDYQYCVIFMHDGNLLLLALCRMAE